MESRVSNGIFRSTDIGAGLSVWPFHSLLPEEKEFAQRHVDFSQRPISAIFVFHDPRNWALDIQIICDIILSGGIVGGPLVDPPKQDIELVFCNPDLLWRSDFPRPRLGQGAFKEAFQAVYKALTGRVYPHVQFGKPTRATFEFAEQVLEDLLMQQGYSNPLPPRYMIGDNPESDIAGAHRAGWHSILVHTGVYDPARGPSEHRPTFEATDVEDAVLLAIQTEFERGGGGVLPNS